MNKDLENAAKALRANKPVVVRTETLYGIIALATSRAAVEAVYEAKSRDLSKQCIVLVSDANEVGEYASVVARYSGEDNPPTSVVVSATGEPEWLLRGGSSIAYRVTRSQFLKELIKEVGPVIAPSANLEGLAPASNIAQAIKYFGDKVGAYIDGGEVSARVQASRIIEVAPDGSEREIRH